MNTGFQNLEPAARRMAIRIIEEIVEPFIMDSRVSELVQMRFMGIKEERYYELVEQI